MYFIYSISLLLLIQQPLIEKRKVNEICQALQTNDRSSLKTIFNDKLASLDSNISNEEKFNVIKSWLEDFDCVDSVEVVPGVLRTDPPIKEFNVYIKNKDDQLVPRNVGIFIYPDKLRFVYR